MANYLYSGKNMAKQPKQSKTMRKSGNPFSRFTAASMANEIKKLRQGVECYPMYMTIFYSIYPGNKQKEMPLKRQYKPVDNVAGFVTDANVKLRADTEAVRAALQKLWDNGIDGSQYINDEASLKLHINLNNIGNLDQKIVTGLIKLLVDEAHKANNMNYHFKIINPESVFEEEYRARGVERFLITDQLTVYLDKYSSTADVIALTKKINQYLLAAGVPENTEKLGPKDKFGFNSFVSARFDTNKLNRDYAEHAFFDWELKKFFEAHKDNLLMAELPLCALESVFNNIILSKTITNLKATPEGALSEEDSKKVQIEFMKMLVAPRKYIADSTEAHKRELDLAVNETTEKMRELRNKILAFKPDFTSCSTSREISITADQQFNHFRTNIIEESKPLFSSIDAQQVDAFNQLLVTQQNSIFQATQTQLIKVNKINPVKGKKFVELMEGLKRKADKLQGSDPVKAKKLLEFHKEVQDEFNDYLQGSTFETFKTNCKQIFKKYNHSLGKHSGDKEFILNFLANFFTLSVVGLNRMWHGKNYFFKVNTDSLNKVEKIGKSVDELNPLLLN